MERGVYWRTVFVALFDVYALQLEPCDLNNMVGCALSASGAGLGATSPRKIRFAKRHARSLHENQSTEQSVQPAQVTGFLISDCSSTSGVSWLSLTAAGNITTFAGHG